MTDSRHRAQAARHDPDLRRAARSSPTSSSCAGATGSFVIPATVAFLAWYLLYVVMCNWAHRLHEPPALGNINVALVFGLLQFAHDVPDRLALQPLLQRRLDPLARELDEQYIAELEGRR